MANWLEQALENIEPDGQERVIALLPAFFCDAVIGVLHIIQYDIDKIEDREQRDIIQALIDEGQKGLVDTVYLTDLLDRLDTMNGHLAEISVQIEQGTAALYTADDVAIADVLQDLALEGAGGAWDDVEIGDLIDNIGIIATLLG